MRILLDTHALLWFLDGSPNVGRSARTLLTDPANDVFASMASLWEIAVKLRIGKLRADLPVIVDAAVRSGFQFLDLKPEHIYAVSALPLLDDHRDPFDHLLIAQAMVERLAFLSDDRNAKRYPVQVIRVRG